MATTRKKKQPWWTTVLFMAVPTLIASLVAWGPKACSDSKDSAVRAYADSLKDRRVDLRIKRLEDRDSIRDLDDTE